MPATTPNFTLPYPVGGDPIDVAGDMSRLALAVDGMKTYIDTHLTKAEGDPLYVFKAGDTMTGQLKINLATGTYGLVVAAAGNEPTISFQSAAGTSFAIMRASLANNQLIVRGDVGYALALGSENISRAIITTAGIFLYGKTATNAATVGSEIQTTGALWLTKNDQLSATIYYNHLASAHVGYGTFRFNGTQIGHISRAAGNASVTYATTSHAPWKAEVTDLDDAAALAHVESLRPVSFRWKRRANGDLAEDGTPSGDPVHGFIAQELVNVAPEAVTPGKGTEAEHWAWMDRAAAAATAAAAREVDPDAPEAEDPGMDPFEPWGVDASKLIPDLVAAVRALSHFNTQLVAALTSILNPADPATFSSLADLIPEG